MGMPAKEPVSHTPCIGCLGHPKYTSCCYVLQGLQYCVTLKASGLLFGDGPLPGASPRHCSLAGQVVRFTPQQIWAEGCLKPTWVLMHVHSPMDSCKPTSSRGMDAFAHQLGRPRRRGLWMGDTESPDLMRHQVSQASQRKKSAYFSHCSVNVLLSAGTNFQWQSFTFFTPRDFW